MSRWSESRCCSRCSGCCRTERGGDGRKEDKCNETHNSTVKIILSIIWMNFPFNTVTRQLGVINDKRYSALQSTYQTLKLHFTLTSNLQKQVVNGLMPFGVQRFI